MVEKDLVSTIIFNPLLKFCSVFITVKKTNVNDCPSTEKNVMRGYSNSVILW